LVAGVDRDGPHLYETCPSGNYYEYYVFFKLILGLFNWSSISISKNLCIRSFELIQDFNFG